MGLIDDFRTAWQLRRPLLATHLAVTVIVAGLVTPLIAGALALAVRLSGQEALADFEIASFLLSPWGFAALTLAGGLVLVALVLETAVMMVIVVSHRQGNVCSFIGALRGLLGRLPALLLLAVGLILRVLLVAAPFLALILWLALPLLQAHDINYYLAYHPPELQTLLWQGALVAAVGSIVLVALLLGWSLSLPGLVLADFKPGDVFARSAAMVSGHRLRLLGLFLGWALIAVLINTLVSGMIVLLGHGLEAWAGDDLTRLIRSMAFLVAAWAMLLAVVATLINGAFAALLADRFEALGRQPSVVPETKAMAVGSRRLIWATLVLIGIALGSVTVTGWLSRTLADDDAVLTIAHRGAAGTRPENTLAAFGKAIEDGADWLELDVQESGDGQVIVVHDSDFMKTSGVAAKVWDVTAAELADIDIGSWFDPAYTDQRTPLLSDVLALAKGRAKVLIELKYYGHDERLEQRVAEVVEAADMVDQIAVMSLKREGIEKMAALRPGWKRGLLLTAAIGDITRLDVDFLAINALAATPPFVAHARLVGMPIMVWTVDEPEQISQMISRGVAGIITDYPDRVPEVVAVRAGLSAAERLLLELSNLLGLTTWDDQRVPLQQQRI